jgi:hypothetical protein
MKRGIVDCNKSKCCQNELLFNHDSTLGLWIRRVPESRKHCFAPKTHFYLQLGKKMSPGLAVCSIFLKFRANFMFRYWMNQRNAASFKKMSCVCLSIFSTISSDCQIMRF